MHILVGMNSFMPLEQCPALVLNSDFRPLSHYPLSLWSWQDSIKAVILDRVNIVSNYSRQIRSPSFEMYVPSVISLKNYIKPNRNPIFSRFNVFCREISKFYEEYIRKNIDELELFTKEPKGEFTVVISGKNDIKNASQELSESDKVLINKMIKKLSIKEITSFFSHNRKLPKKEIYNYCLKLKNEK